MIRADRCPQCGAQTVRRYCLDCSARRIADAHDECSCKWCAHAARLRETERDREDARVHGGLCAEFKSLFGGIDR